MFQQTDAEKKGKAKWLNPKNFPKNLPQSEIEELKKNRPIVLSYYDNVMLFFSRLLGTLACCCCWGKRKKLEKMYDEVEERITKELDVVKLIKSVNDSKLAMKASLMDPDLKFQITHSYKNIVDLDRETSDDEDEEPDDKGDVTQKVAP